MYGYGQATEGKKKKSFPNFKWPQHKSTIIDLPRLIISPNIDQIQ